MILALLSPIIRPNDHFVEQFVLLRRDNVSPFAEPACAVSSLKKFLRLLFGDEGKGIKNTPLLFRSLR